MRVPEPKRRALWSRHVTDRHRAPPTPVRDPRLVDPTHKVKITRGDVYRTVGMTALVAPSNGLVRKYFNLMSGRDRPPTTPQS